MKFCAARHSVRSERGTTHGGTATQHGKAAAQQQASRGACGQQEAHAHPLDVGHEQTALLLLQEVVKRLSCRCKVRASGACCSPVQHNAAAMGGGRGVQAISVPALTVLAVDLDFLKHLELGAPLLRKRLDLRVAAWLLPTCMDALPRHPSLWRTGTCALQSCQTAASLLLGRVPNAFEGNARHS